MTLSVPVYKGAPNVKDWAPNPSDGVDKRYVTSMSDVTRTMKKTILICRVYDLSIPLHCAYVFYSYIDATAFASPKQLAEFLLELDKDDHRS